jgi:hypothetical protein
MGLTAFFLEPSFYLSDKLLKLWCAMRDPALGGFTAAI